VDEILRFWAVNTFWSIWMVTVEVCITIIIFMKRTGCFQFALDFNLSFAGFGINDASRAVNFPIDNPVTEI